MTPHFFVIRCLVFGVDQDGVQGVEGLVVSPDSMAFENSGQFFYVPLIYGKPTLVRAWPPVELWEVPDFSIFLLRFSDHAVSSVKMCSYYRPLVLEMMVKVKAQILFCICGFSVYCEIQGAIIIKGSTWVQERQLAFRFRSGGELYVLLMLLM